MPNSLSLRQRMGVSLARFAMRWSGLGGGTRNLGGYTNYFGRLVGALPGSNIDLARDVGDPSLNSTASICLNWIADQIIEAQFTVSRKKRDKTLEPQEGHALAELIENPNPYYDGDALWASTLVSYCTDGNAFWLKVPGMGGAGRTVQLWYVPHWQIQPRWPPDGSAFLSHFDYTVDGRIYRVERDELVWFHDKIDPIRRRGISRLYPLLREVASDNEISTYYQAILKNVGVVSVMITPKEANALGGPEVKELKSQWDEDFTGDNRGRPLVPSIPMEVQKLAITPNDMALDKIAGIPAGKICSALRVSPLAVDLNVGGVHATYDNQGVAQKKSYHNCVIPIGKRLAKTLDRQLLPDFEGSPAYCCGWDYSGIEAIREDVDLLHKRAREDYQKGIAKLNEARSWIQLPPVPEPEDGFFKPPPKGDGLDENPKKKGDEEEDPEDDSEPDDEEEDE